MIVTGNGTATDALSNAFRVTFAGKAYGLYPMQPLARTTPNFLNGLTVTLIAKTASDNSWLWMATLLKRLLLATTSWASSPATPVSSETATKTGWASGNTMNMGRR